MVISTHAGQLYEDEASFWLNQPMEGSEDLKKSPNYNPKTDVYQAPNEQQPLEKPKQIHIVRHGETTANDDNTVRGTKIPISLNERGRQEAVEAADSLKSKGVDTIVSSTLPRARETAEIIGKKLGVSPQYDRRLATWDVGKYEGQDCDKANPELKEYAQNKQDEAPPGGESFNDFTNRSFAGIRDAVLNNKANNVAIVTHNRVEATLRGWEKTGQDNPNIDYNEVVKESTPGNVRSMTFQPDSTIMNTFDDRFVGQKDEKLPVDVPGYDPNMLADRWWKSLNPGRSLFPDEAMRIGQDQDVQTSLPMDQNAIKAPPYLEQKDLDLYNPIADIYDPKKVVGHIDPSEFLNPMPGSKFATTGPKLSLEQLKQINNRSKVERLGLKSGRNITGKRNRGETNETLDELDRMKGTEGTPNWFKEEMKQTLEKELMKNPSQQQQGKTPEIIKSAAIRTKDINGKERIYEGQSHLNALDKIGAEGDYGGAPMEDGFMTSTGRFVDRKEAAKIADAVYQRDSKGHPSAISEEFNFNKDR